MHRHDRPRAASHRRLQRFGIKLKVLRLNVHKHWHRAQSPNGACRGKEGKAGDNDLISGGDVAGHQREQHGVAAEIAGAETIILDNLQHLGLMEAPRAFTGPMLDFLDRRP